ncbi:hypothetical protein GGR52DRAFT_561018 [Hypoxylon sp. FL1284]|nr:hypothetical protein GGR52DRAFT_561018 [Hypoxylon sp. FL1284]
MPYHGAGSLPGSLSRTVIRFIVPPFIYGLGFATAYSVYVPASRPDDALPSRKSDTYPVMVAQLLGSLVSPLFFGLVSFQKRAIPIRQKITSFYHILLVLGVLMSILSLLLYSLWPAGYRVIDVIMIVGLVFSTLGSWQSLEEDWDEAMKKHLAAFDIEMAQRPT